MHIKVTCAMRGFVCSNQENNFVFKKKKKEQETGVFGEFGNGVFGSLYDDRLVQVSM